MKVLKHPLGSKGYRASLEGAMMEDHRELLWQPRPATTEERNSYGIGYKK